MSEIVVKFISADCWWERAKWELAESYVSINGKVEVPKGFITDGASIPIMFRAIFPATGKYFSAAIIHDYILVETKDWSYANEQFKAELNGLKIDSWRKDIMVAGVNLWSWALDK